MKIKVTDNSLSHPIEECLPDLYQLLAEIQDRQTVIYEVPYEQIDQINIELNGSPEEDLTLFNYNYAYVQGQVNRVAHILIQIKKELRVWTSYKSRLKLLYRKARNLLLTSKPEIKALRNKELQEAAIQKELESMVDLADGLDIIIEELDHDMDIVNIKKDALDKANVNLSRQQKIVEDIMAIDGIVGVRGVRIRAKPPNSAE